MTRLKGLQFFELKELSNILEYHVKQNFSKYYELNFDEIEDFYFNSNGDIFLIDCWGGLATIDYYTDNLDCCLNFPNYNNSDYVTFIRFFKEYLDYLSIKDLNNDDIEYLIDLIINCYWENKKEFIIQLVEFIKKNDYSKKIEFIKILEGIK